MLVCSGINLLDFWNWLDPSILCSVLAFIAFNRSISEETEDGERGRAIQLDREPNRQPIVRREDHSLRRLD